MSDIFTEKAAGYITAAWQVLGPEKRSADDVVKSRPGLEPAVVQRWVRFLDPSQKREYAYLDAWNSLLGKGGSEAEAKKIAEEFQSLLLSVRKEQKELDAKNATLKARTGEGEMPKFIPIERSKYYLLKDLAEEPDTKTHKEAGPFYFSPEEVGHYLTSVYKDYFDALRARVDKMQADLPTEYAYFPVIKDKAKIRNLHVYIRGDKDNPGEEAPRQFLQILSPGKQAPFTKGSGRLELAEAIADAKNPLTSRVMANRIWLHHFGAGLVDTPGNFGKLGSPPSNPELLDYLSSRFVEYGWSMKKMHREIMLSATYALSSQYSERNYAVDPDNRLLWRANLQRVDVETMRDSLLAVAGKLDATIGGPALPLHDEKNCRRTVYASISRANPDSFMRLFDFPDPNETSEQRMVTNVPVQELFFLNSGFVRKQAEALAERLASAPAGPARIQASYELLFGRAPTPEEVRAGSAFLADKGAGWREYLEVLLSSNEFNYIN